MTFRDVIDLASEYYSAYVFGLVVITALLCLFWDAPTLQREGIRRDATLLRVIGVSYLVLGILVMVALRILAGIL